MKLNRFLRFYDLSPDLFDENWFSIFTRCRYFLLIESFDLMFVCNFQGAERGSVDGSCSQVSVFLTFVFLTFFLILWNRPAVPGAYGLAALP